jgi:protein-tyrosine-phosphatase
MASKKSILFVCTGNTCRSPMAEGLFRKAVSGRGDFQIASAGVSAYPGDRISTETEKILKARGAEIPQFRSQPVTAELLEQASHVFAMTEGHLRSLMAQFPGQGVGADVPDPFGMGRKAYEETAKVLDLAIPSLIAFLDQTTE